MKHIIKIDEYYSGKNSTIGFRYSEPKLKSNAKILFFGDDNLETEVREKLDSILDDYTIDISKVNDLGFMEEILDRFPEFIVSKIIEEKYNLSEMSLDLVTYDEDEIFSLFVELANKQDTYIVAPILLVNDEPYDQNAKFNAKEKIGFKK